MIPKFLQFFKHCSPKIRYVYAGWGMTRVPLQPHGWVQRAWGLASQVGMLGSHDQSYYMAVQ